MWLFHCGIFNKLAELSKFTQAQKVSRGGAISCGVLAANTVYYEVCAYLKAALICSLPKTLNLTPPELMRKAG